MKAMRLAILAAVLAAAGCDTGGVDLNNAISVPPVVANATIVDANGQPQGPVDPFAPVQLAVAGLPANERFAIQLFDPAGTEISPAGGYTINSDEEGRIPTSTVVQDLGAVAAAKYGIAKSAYKAQFGNYRIQIVTPSGNVVGRVNFTVHDASRLYCANASGAEEGSFLTTEHVFVRIERAGGSLADGAYRLYLLSDLNQTLNNGDSLGGSFRDVTVAGGTALVDLGTFNGGEFDVVLDVNRNGSFDHDVDLISRHPRQNPCFTIQAPVTTQPIIQQICADAEGNYRDVFDPTVGNRENRDMFAFITPNRRSGAEHVLAVRKYVVPHQNTWTTGQGLNDVTAGFEVDPVQGFCTNEAPWLVWPRQLFVPGCYDVIIDVNRNGTYDEGVDFLDNIDQRGETTCGCRVPDVNCADRIHVTAPAAGTTVETTTTQLTGTVTGSPTRGYATVVSSAQSNRIDLEITPTTGAFGGRIPLFRGENLVTVTMEYPDGTACSVTITITSNPPAASTLFRVQLTWDGDTDSDLHVVRPHAGGNGLFTADDCYYSNCQRGSTAGANSVEWGLPGEDDDPTLDVDCVACGVGVENIFISQINDDGTYTIFVDQFGGQEDNVVTVFIHETQVGQVVCPHLDQTTDTCRVGTIDWAGGTGGNGTFIADGRALPRGQFPSKAAKPPKH